MKPVGGATNAFYVIDSAISNSPTVITYTDLDQSISPGVELRVYFGATTDGNALEADSC